MPCAAWLRSLWSITLVAAIFVSELTCRSVEELGIRLGQRVNIALRARARREVADTP